MSPVLAVVFFALAVLVHGAAVSTHTNWIDTTGLALLGLLCLALSGITTWTPWRK